MNNEVYDSTFWLAQLMNRDKVKRVEMSTNNLLRISCWKVSFLSRNPFNGVS